MSKTAFDIVKGLDLRGKVFLVTGAYSGLGAATTEALLKAKATVIVCGRNAKSQADFAKQLKANRQINCSEEQVDASHTLDLGDLASVRDFAKYVDATYPRIDCLINNAGAMYAPPGKTKNGFETQFGVNVIGHFLLSKMLAGKTQRQVWVSSRAHARLGAPSIDYDAITEVDAEQYNPQLRYQQSKLGNILLAKQFGEVYPHMRAVSLHPGVVRTSLGRHLSFFQKLQFILRHPIAIMTMKTPQQGASTQTLVATMPASELQNGAYYADCAVFPEAESGKDMADAKKLFDYCDEVTKDFQA